MRTLILFAAMFAAAAHAAEWSKQFQVTGKPELRVEADDAAVSVKPGAGNTVDARVTTRGWEIGPEGVRVIEHQTGNRIEIEVRIPHEHWGFGNRSVRLDLAVPRELRADIHTGDGHVSADGVAGEFRFTTGDGGIQANSLDGALDAHTGDGSIRVQGRFDTLELRTGDGSVEAAVASGSKIVGLWRVQTGDGSVTLRLPEKFAADVDAHTGDGHISVDLPLETNGIRDNNLRGRINGGGGTLRIETGDGSIRLQRL